MFKILLHYQSFHSLNKLIFGNLGKNTLRGVSVWNNFYDFFAFAFSKLPYKYFFDLFNQSTAISHFMYVMSTWRTKWTLCKIRANAIRTVYLWTTWTHLSRGIDILAKWADQFIHYLKIIVLKKPSNTIKFLL